MRAGPGQLMPPAPFGPLHGSEPAMRRCPHHTPGAGLQGAKDGDLVDALGKVCGFFVHFSDEKVCGPCGGLLGEAGQWYGAGEGMAQGRWAPTGAGFCHRQLALPSPRVHLHGIKPLRYCLAPPRVPRVNNRRNTTLLSLPPPLPPARWLSRCRTGTCARCRCTARAGTRT